MKIYLRSLLFTVLCVNLAAHAQMGSAPGPRFGGPMDKLFGKNQAFSATLDMQMKPASGGSVVEVPGKIAVDSGKSRFEMDMSEMKGHQMSPETAAHMKAMGMDKMITVSLSQDKTAYVIYPDMHAYVQMSIQNPDAAKPESDFKMETTELGKETVDGHPCIKNKVVVTDQEGNQHESTVWNATDLKKFPIKIEQDEEGHQVTMLFKDINFSKPNASLFQPPTGYTKYDNMGAMMHEEMMKHIGGGMGSPPPSQP